jgi:hypothetical protein
MEKALYKNQEMNLQETESKQEKIEFLKKRFREFEKNLKEGKVYTREQLNI